MADAKRICSVPGCDNDYRIKRGLCSAHYQRFQRYGDPLGGQHKGRRGGPCDVNGCSGLVYQDGFCLRHYRRHARYGDPLAGKPSPKPPGPCEVSGCTSKRFSSDYCRNHHHRLKLYGDPLAGPTAKGEPERWLTVHVDWSGADCLIWPFSRNDRKYGRFGTEDGRREYAHRRMCELVNGPPPTPEHEAAHSCGRGYDGCVHPGHLRWDTKQGNASDRTLHGTEVRGEDCWNAKLTEADVRAIRKLQGLEVQRITAERYGVSRATIGDIQNRKRWAWLD